jgi:hypothetical protein
MRDRGIHEVVDLDADRHRLPGTEQFNGSVAL